MTRSVEYPESYEQSRTAFRRLAGTSSDAPRAYPLPRCDERSIPEFSTDEESEVKGRDLDSLSVDVAYRGPNSPRRLVLVSSGLHGVEGFFGAAVQLRLLATQDAFAGCSAEKQVGLLLVHALNPHGFAQRRRWNEENVDLNRNFLLHGENYRGAPPLYGELNSLLNPTGPPSKFDFFAIRALKKVARTGLASLRQAIAGGQYAYPRGLFYGGQRPAATQVLLREELPGWVLGAEEIVHLDFHTGLGRWGTYQLLIDEPPDSRCARRLAGIFGGDVVRGTQRNEKAYRAQGGFGPWCGQLLADRDYTYACAEFGTYGPLRVLAGLRKENQAYWHTPPDSPARRAAADRLQELFCPASPNWRARVLADGVKLVEVAIQALGR